MDRLEVGQRRLLRDDPAPIVVALSGGGDSVALLQLTCAWARVAGRPVLAVTVDHRLHPESGAWTRFAGDAAAREGAAFRASTPSAVVQRAEARAAGACK